jgi:septum formation protein
MKYILASGSPRRRELLARIGIEFEVIPSDVDEIITKEVPSDIVMELAYQKALCIHDKYNLSDKYNLPNKYNLPEQSNISNFVVIGADTIVVYRDEILGKPADKAEAFDMLSMLADRTHQVYTGVSLLVNIGGKLTTKTFFEKTDVTLYPISKEDLHTYVDSGDPLDKAGAYGIQGDFAIHIKGICGDYNNVVGLPIGRLYQEMKSVIPLNT